MLFYLPPLPSPIVFGLHILNIYSEMHFSFVCVCGHLYFVTSQIKPANNDSIYADHHSLKWNANWSDYPPSKEDKNPEFLLPFLVTIILCPTSFFLPLVSG